MRAWTVPEFGILQLEEIPRPRPEPGTVVARVLAAGINFQDRLLIAGTYQVKPERPFVPGFEVLGEVVELGEGVSGVGDRVIAWAGTGGYGEYVRLAIGNCFPVPRGMSDEEGAAFLISFQTAWFALVHRARLSPGEVLLVHAGAGGLGSAAIQIGKALGARVVATAGSEEKAAFCRRLGADHVLSTDFVAAVQEITSGAGADVILDPVGGETFASSTRCLAWEGRILPLGFAGGEVPTIAAHRILLKNIAVIGLHWSKYLHRDPALAHDTQNKLNELFEAGKIRPVVTRRYAMEELPEALAAFDQRTVLGKTVLGIKERLPS